MMKLATGTFIKLIILMEQNKQSKICSNSVKIYDQLITCLEQMSLQNCLFQRQLPHFNSQWIHKSLSFPQKPRMICAHITLRWVDYCFIFHLPQWTYNYHLGGNTRKQQRSSYFWLQTKLWLKRDWSGCPQRSQRTNQRFKKAQSWVWWS